MEIAKGINNSHYLRLNLNDSNSPDWEEAIDILEKRITERYIEPVDKLIELEKDISPNVRKYGFVILATDCMVLENLQSFYEGKKDSNGKSEKIFIRFLTQRENFKEHFDIKSATTFYRDFRCAILHQLETYNDSKIWSVGPLVVKKDNGLIINRTKFHEEIKKESKIYFKTLRSEIELRQNFKIKMDYICKR